MKQLNMKTPAVFKAAMILLCALVVTTYMISGLYARYTTSRDGADGAIVARFEFSDNFDEKMQTLTLTDMFPGDEREITVEISNDSETTIRCIVELENLTNNLPVVPAEGIVVTSGTIVPDSEGQITVRLEWDELKNSIAYAEMIDVIRISVRVEQTTADI